MKQPLSVQIDTMRYDGSQKELIKNFRLTVRPGELVSIMGPSGCGKTTLLRIIAGLEKNYLGEVHIGEDLITGPSRRVQMTFQDHRLFPWMSARENIAFAIASPGDRQSEPSRMLEAFGLTERAMAWPSQLSGGEQSRVSLARALIEPSDVLLLDEPLRSLDLQTRISVGEQLRKALKGRKVITLLVSHDIEDALVLSDRVLVLTRHPMIVAAEFSITLPYPRSRSDDTVREVGAKILREIERLSGVGRLAK